MRTDVGYRYIESAWKTCETYNAIHAHAVASERARAKGLVEALEEIEDQVCVGDYVVAFNSLKGIATRSIKAYREAGGGA